LIVQRSDFFLVFLVLATVLPRVSPQNLPLWRDFLSECLLTQKKRKFFKSRSCIIW
jgi:hypothetical protein